MAVFSDIVIKVFFDKKDAEKGMKELKDSAKNTSNSITSGMMKAMGAFGGLYFGAKAIKNVYDNSLKMVDLANKWDRPVEGISKFTNALSLIGGSTDEALGDLNTLEQALIDLRTTGAGPLKEVSSQIGLTLYNQNGNLKNSLELITELRNKLSRVKDEKIKTKVIQELGLDNTATLRLLKMSDTEYAKIQKRAEKGIIKEKDAKRLDNFRMSLARLKQSFSVLSRELMLDFAPVLDKVVALMDKLADNPEAVKTILGIAGALAGLKAIKGLSDLVGVSKVLKDLATVGKSEGFISVVKQLGLLGVAIAGIVASAKALTDMLGKDSSTIRQEDKKIREEWDWSKDWWRLDKMARAGGNWLGDLLVSDKTPKEIQEKYKDYKPQSRYDNPLERQEIIEMAQKRGSITPDEYSLLTGEKPQREYSTVKPTTQTNTKTVNFYFNDTKINANNPQELFQSLNSQTARGLKI